MLVGRTPERRAFRDQLDAALEGQGSCLLLGGEAGIGKTTLARDFTTEAQRRGLLVLAGHCYDLTATPPYGPWLDLAAHYHVADGLPPLPDALQVEGIEHVASRAALFTQVQGFLARLATACPTVVILEDLHWADTASVELLRHIARDLTALPLLVVVTYRVDEPGRNQPFARHLPALIRETEGVRLDLRPLDDDDLRRLVTVHRVLRPGDESRLCAYLARRAEGNPFYIAELLRMLEDHGLLYETDQDWTLGELDSAPVPPLLRQIIDQRVARLGEEMRHPLAIAAVIGQEVPLDLWSTVAAISEETVLAVVERAIEAHLFEAGADDTRVRFVHALTREALYEGIAPPRRRRWHRQVAEALAGDAPSGLDAVASHFQLAGDPRAPEWLVRAGERAQRAYAWSTAVDRLAAAATLLDGVPGQEALRASLLYRCGRLQRYSRPRHGIVNLTDAEHLAAAIGDRHLEADARYSRGLLHCYADDFGTGVAEMAAGIEALESLPRDHRRSEAAVWFADALPIREPEGGHDGEAADAFLHAHGWHHRRGNLPWFTAVAGRLAEAHVMSEAFITLATEFPSPGVLLLSDIAHAHHGLGITHAAYGQVQPARDAFSRARGLYRQLDHHAAIGFTLLCEMRDVVLPFLTMELDERRNMAAAAAESLARAGGALPDDVSPRRALLGLLFIEGQWTEALQVADDTPVHGNYCLRREVTGVLGPIAVAQGQPDRAWAQIHALLPNGPTTAPGHIVFMDGLVLQRLAAALCQEAGALAEAAAWLEAHDRWLRWSGAVLGRADGHVAWAHFWRAAGEPARSYACANDAVSAAESPLQPLARLAALRIRGAAAAAAAGDAGAAEDDLQVALAIADACAAPYERALTLIALAEIRLTHHATTVVSALLDEARTICQPLGAQPALDRIDSLTSTMPARSNAAHARSPLDQFGLTPREIEILELLATGQTNIEIAKVLCLSPGTVRNHVSIVLGKLGARTRTEAAARARDHGLV